MAKRNINKEQKELNAREIDIRLKQGASFVGSSNDPFSTPARDNYQTYPYDYFAGTDCKIFFGDIWVDDIVTIQYSTTQNKTPIYGYASQNFDAVARGQVLVEGSLAISFKETGYLNIIQAQLEAQLNNSQNGIKGKIQAYKDEDSKKFIPGINSINEEGQKIDFNYSPTGTPEIIRQEQTIEQILTNKKGKDNLSAIAVGKVIGTDGTQDFEDFAEVLEDSIWGDSNGKFLELEDKLKRADEFDYNQHGGINTAKNSSYSDVLNIMLTFGDLNDYRAEHTIVVLNDVHFLSTSMMVSPDGNPIAEVYNFIARDINKSITSKTKSISIQPIKLNVGNSALKLSKLADVDTVQSFLEQSTYNSPVIKIESVLKDDNTWEAWNLSFKREDFNFNKITPFIDQLCAFVENRINTEFDEYTEAFPDGRYDKRKISNYFQLVVSVDFSNSIGVPGVNNKVVMILEQGIKGTYTFRVISPTRSGFSAVTKISREDFFHSYNPPLPEELTKDEQTKWVDKLNQREYALQQTELALTEAGLSKAEIEEQKKALQDEFNWEDTVELLKQEGLNEEQIKVYRQELAKANSGIIKEEDGELVTEDPATKAVEEANKNLNKDLLEEQSTQTDENTSVGSPAFNREDISTFNDDQMAIYNQAQTKIQELISTQSSMSEEEYKVAVQEIQNQYWADLERTLPTTATADNTISGTPAFDPNNPSTFNAEQTQILDRAQTKIQELLSDYGQGLTGVTPEEYDVRMREIQDQYWKELEGTLPTVAETATPENTQPGSTPSIVATSNVGFSEIDVSRSSNETYLRAIVDDFRVAGKVPTIQDVVNEARATGVEPTEEDVRGALEHGGLTQGLVVPVNNPNQGTIRVAVFYDQGFNAAGKLVQTPEELQKLDEALMIELNSQYGADRNIEVRRIPGGRDVAGNEIVAFFEKDYDPTKDINLVMAHHGPEKATISSKINSLDPRDHISGADLADELEAKNVQASLIACWLDPETTPFKETNSLKFGVSTKVKQSVHATTALKLTIESELKRQQAQSLPQLASGFESRELGEDGELPESYTGQVIGSKIFKTDKALLRQNPNLPKYTKITTVANLERPRTGQDPLNVTAFAVAEKNKVAHIYYDVSDKLKEGQTRGAILAEELSHINEIHKSDKTPEQLFEEEKKHIYPYGPIERAGAKAAANPANVAAAENRFGKYLQSQTKQYLNSNTSSQPKSSITTAGFENSEYYYTDGFKSMFKQFGDFAVKNELGTTTVRLTPELKKAFPHTNYVTITYFEDIKGTIIEGGPEEIQPSDSSNLIYGFYDSKRSAKGDTAYIGINTRENYLLGGANTIAHELEHDTQFKSSYKAGLTTQQLRNIYFRGEYKNRPGEIAAREAGEKYQKLVARELGSTTVTRYLDYNHFSQKYKDQLSKYGFIQWKSIYGF